MAKRKQLPDRHGEWDRCHRCDYPAQITRAIAYGGFLKLHDDGLILCWNGRDCVLRYRRKQRQKEWGVSVKLNSSEGSDESTR